MELVKIWEAECKLIPMYEAEIGKTFLKKFCVKELDPEDHVPGKLNQFTILIAVYCDLIALFSHASARKLGLNLHLIPFIGRL